MIGVELDQQFFENLREPRDNDKVPFVCDIQHGSKTNYSGLTVDFTILYTVHSRYAVRNRNIH